MAAADWAEAMALQFQPADDEEEGPEDEWIGLEHADAGLDFSPSGPMKHMTLKHGDPFTEKKSTFQAHLAVVHSKEEVCFWPS